MNRFDVTQIAQAYLFLNGPLSNSIQHKLQQVKPTEATEVQYEAYTQLKQHYAAAIIKQELLIGAWYVDIYFELKGKKIVIELDGPDHYDETGALRHNDRLRDLWLQQQGYQVVRVLNREQAKVVDKVRVIVEASVASTTNIDNTPYPTRSTQPIPSRPLSVSSSIFVPMKPSSPAKPAPVPKERGPML